MDRDYQEVITYSFVDAGLLHVLAPDVPAVALANPISSEMGIMRSTLWAGLVSAVRHNLARQQRRIRLFESGLKFISQDHDIKQDKYLSGIVTGDLFPEQCHNFCDRCLTAWRRRATPAR